VLRLTQDDRAVAEIAAIAEHMASLTAAAAAFQLRPDVPLESGDGDSSLIPLVDAVNSGEASESLAEIHGWAKQTLGIDHVPAIWRALAYHPRLLPDGVPRASSRNMRFHLEHDVGFLLAVHDHELCIHGQVVHEARRDGAIVVGRFADRDERLVNLGVRTSHYPCSA